MADMLGRENVQAGNVTEIADAIDVEVEADVSALATTAQLNATEAAISAALAPVRIADAGNSSVAAIGNLGVFTGAWHRTDGPGGVWARVDIALTLAAAGTLAVQHSDDGVNPIAADTETWVAAAAAHPIFPTPLKRTWYRVVLTDTGGGGAVTLAVTLDPRIIPRIVLAQAAVTVNASPATQTHARPLGARAFFVTGCATATAVALGVLQRDAAAGPLDYRTMSTASGVVQLDAVIPLAPTCADVLLSNLAAAVVTGTVHWYAHTP